MAELKTKRTEASVEKFLKGVKDKQMQADCFQIMQVMKNVTKTEPRMWGTSIVGFGEYHYKYESGREGDWFVVGFSPRKQNLTLYLMDGLVGQEELLGKLGRHTTGKGCLYIKRLDDIDARVLKKLITDSAMRMRQKKS